jgi:hypothetical protein
LAALSQNTRVLSGATLEAACDSRNPLTSLFAAAAIVARLREPGLDEEASPFGEEELSRGRALEFLSLLLKQAAYAPDLGILQAWRDRKQERERRPPIRLGEAPLLALGWLVALELSADGIIDIDPRLQNAIASPVQLAGAWCVRDASIGAQAIQFVPKSMLLAVDQLRGPSRADGTDLVETIVAMLADTSPRMRERIRGLRGGDQRIASAIARSFGPLIGRSGTVLDRVRSRAVSDKDAVRTLAETTEIPGPRLRRLLASLITRLKGPGPMLRVGGNRRRWRVR